MVAAVSAAANSTGKTYVRPSTPSARPPLLPSESEKRQPQLRHSNVASKKPRGKQVPSRYLSPSSSCSTTTSSSTTSAASTASSSSSYPSIAKTCPSPLNRSQSVDKRRIGVTGRASLPLSPNVETKQINESEISAATKMLITSTRSLSVSFQGEAFSLPISKAKVSASGGNSGRKPTPERRRPSTPGRDQCENNKPVDQHRRWLGKIASGNLSESNSSSSRSLNYSEVSSDSAKPLNRTESGLADENRRFSLNIDRIKQNSYANLLADSSLSTGDLNSDTGSVSSVSTNSSRGIGVTARFWQETNSGLRRILDPTLPSSPSSRIIAPSKSLSSKRFSTDSSSSPRSIASPLRGAARPASLSKLCTATVSSPSRALSSPSKVRPVSGSFDTTPSILTFPADLRRRKVGEDKIVDAHKLRLLYNYYLQWRFVNARADSSFVVQSHGAEKDLWNSWVKISELRHTVTLKRIKFLLLRKKLKLSTILKGQICHLEEWAHIDEDHIASLEGATRALKGSTLRLPIVGKAVANVQTLKEAVSSAVDVMQAMASSICSLSKRIDDANNLISELVCISVKERLLLDQCKEFLTTLTAMQVTYCSLRAHIIQVNCS